MLGLVKALGTTMRNAMRKPVTVQYPTEKKVLPHRSRGFPVLLWNFDNDEPFCTGCQVCARYCPVECITVTMKDNPKHATGESKRKKIVDRFFLDYARCMRCDICVEVCNFAAIVSTDWPGQTDEINVIAFNDISTALFTTWAIPFEIASLLLMVALIGAIILARGEEGD